MAWTTSVAGVAVMGAEPPQKAEASIRYRVPGKLMLAGEYAVLEGGPAVMIAVDRYVKAVRTFDVLTSKLLVTTRSTTSAGDTEESITVELPLGIGAAKPTEPLIAACIASLEADLERIPHAYPIGLRPGEVVPSLRGAVRYAAFLPGSQLEIDSTHLSEITGPDSRTKLGLGSSAAATVAFMIGLLGDAIDSAWLFTLADRAHRQFQGGVGSGADIAASVYGGVIEFQRNPIWLEEPPRIRALGEAGRTGCVGIAVWTGQSASTTKLVAAVQELRQASKARYQSCIDALGSAAHATIEALAAGDSSSLIEAIESGYLALTQLGNQASVPLVLPAHERLRGLAQRHSGAAKPTGAGGGDIALAVLPPGADVDAFLVELESRGMRHVALGVSERGAQIVTSPADTPNQAVLRL